MSSGWTYPKHHHNDSCFQAWKKEEDEFSSDVAYEQRKYKRYQEARKERERDERKIPGFFPLMSRAKQDELRSEDEREQEKKRDRESESLRREVRKNKAYEGDLSSNEAGKSKSREEYERRNAHVKKRREDERRNEKENEREFRDRRAKMKDKGKGREDN